MKIIDCFIFYNELDMLNYRLAVLDENVDYFILVESTHTHTGVEKTCTFNDYKELYDKYSAKIIHIIVDDFPHKQPNMDVSKNQQWTNENFQRNCIKRGINKLKLDPEDVLLVSDLDEIPDPNTLAAIKRGEIKVDIHQFVQDFYYYNLNSKMNEKWFLAKAMSFKKYLELNINFQDVRMYNRTKGCPKIENGGWHLSYFGDKYFIRNKIQNFTHQEFNKEQYTDLDKIEERINSCNDVYDRRGVKLQKIPILENTYLPPKYNEYLKNYIIG
jgi:beta-1,4-mannosyl-glycoprotein beta-1,4-N-acetylglucosaminyltransferase